MKILAVVFAAVLLLGAALAVPAAADEHNQSGNSTDTTDENENEEESGSESNSDANSSDGVVRVDAGSAGSGSDFIVNIGDDEEIDTSEIYASMGPEVTIHGVRYEPGDSARDPGSMYIDVSVSRPGGTQLSYIDVSGAQQAEGDVGGRIPTVDVPEGTHRLRIPAGYYDGQARVVLSGLGYYQSVTAPAPSSSFLDDVLTYKYAIATIIAVIAGTLLRVGYKFYREQDSGHPETSDGVPIRSGTIGIEGADHDE